MKDGIELDKINPHIEVMYNKNKIMQAYEDILKLSGFDNNHPALKRTSERQWEILEVMTRGYERVVTLERMYHTYTPKDVPATLVVIPGCKFVSTCEHHFAPFFGEVHVAYIPNKGKVTGLSKIPQLVMKYALRPQIQEKMCEQIAQELMDVCNLDDVMVVITGKHTCEIIEGVVYGYSRDKPYPTSTIRGRFISTPELRQEAMILMGLTI